MPRFTATVMRIDDLTPTVRRFVFAAPEGWGFRAGQFVTARFTGTDGQIVKRSYSIASAPSQRETFELCVKKVEGGQGTRFFFSLQEGATAGFVGPLGGFTVTDVSRPLVFISTGTGIAPLKAMIEDALEHGAKQVLLLEGYRHEDEVLYADWKAAMAEAYPHFGHHSIISRPKTEGKQGYVHALIDALVTDPDQDFYICGLRAMIDEAESRLRAKGASAIYFERYD